MRCNPFMPQTRICQAAQFADDLVEEAFLLELTGGLSTQGKFKNALSGRSSPFRTQEETITESVLVRLSVFFGDVVQAETFTRPAEKIAGADWFWILAFGQKLLPLLVQAKRIHGAWDGDPNWSINISLEQKQKLEATAKNWNVDAHFCVYAPVRSVRRQVSALDACLSDDKDGYQICGGGFMHLLPSSAICDSKFDSNDRHVISQLIPFTCFCCCATDPTDAVYGLNISSNKFREAIELEKVLNEVREDESIKGIAVFQMVTESR